MQGREASDAKKEKKIQKDDIFGKIIPQISIGSNILWHKYLYRFAVSSNLSKQLNSQSFVKLY